jgi:hypothetical protein
MPPHTITAEGVSQAWNDTVNNYCQRKLSNPRDKLIAIAAFAWKYTTQYSDVVYNMPRPNKSVADISSLQGIDAKLETNQRQRRNE